MIEQLPPDDWHVRLVKPRLGFGAQPMLPADVRRLLCETLLARENQLEDAQFRKIVPNRFIVELPPDTYARHYRPIENRICAQWRDGLLDYLATTNSRQGRREYSFAGQVVIEVVAAADLEAGHLRIRSRFQPDVSGGPAPASPPACLQLLPNGRQWPLRPGTVTIGRDEACDVALNLPGVRERPLVSGHHAYLNCAAGMFRLFDGTPDGASSTNGTFVNGQPVPPNGWLLQDGDVIILAALDQRHPDWETPGVVGLRFHVNCG